MASNIIDAPLDDVIKQKRSFGNRRGFRGGARGRGGRGGGGGVKRLSTGKKFGVKNFGSSNGTLSDLRDKLAKKEVGDLRQKISTPKIQPLHVKTVQSVPANNKRPPLRAGGRNRAMTTGGMNNRQSQNVPTFQLSHEEMKKIQITVPGRNRPVETPPPRSSSSNYRSPRSRDEPRPPSRPVPPRNSGEQFVRRTLNSVFHYPPPNVRSRSPSPFGAALEDYRYHRESLAQYGGSGPPTISQYSRGLQTGTCLVISNLNNTVSKGDVIELCQAIGPLDMVRITGPGIAEVIFINKEDAMEAYKKYHHRNLDGQPMICKLQMASATSQYDNIRDPYPSSSRYSAGGGGGRRDSGYIDYDREDYLGRTDYAL